MNSKRTRVVRVCVQVGVCTEFSPQGIFVVGIFAPGNFHEFSPWEFSAWEFSPLGIFAVVILINKLKLN